jgi:hypothetical protein
LKVVWTHHILPQLEEYFALQPNRLKEYDPDVLLGRNRRDRGRLRAMSGKDPDPTAAESD